MFFYFSFEPPNLWATNLWGVSPYSTLYSFPACLLRLVVSIQDDLDCVGVVDANGAALEKCCKDDGVCIAEVDFDLTACGKMLCGRA